MARIKIKDLRGRAEPELRELLAGEREKLLELKMRAHESKPKNVKEAREIRKNVARILTLLKNKH